MKVRIEIEIKDDTCEDLQAILVRELYEQCQSWVNGTEIPFIEFIRDDEDKNIPKSYSDFQWIWDKKGKSEIN